MDKFMHDHCLRFVFLLFHFPPRNYLDSNYRKFSTDEHNKHLVYVTCLQRLTKGVQLRCNPTLFNGGLYWATEVIFIDFLWRESSLSLVKYQLFDVDQLVNKSYHTQDPSPPLVNTYRSSLKTQDQHNMSNIHKYQIRKRLINYTSLHVYLPRKKKSKCQLNLSFHAYLFFFYLLCVKKTVGSLSRFSSIGLKLNPYSLHIDRALVFTGLRGVNSGRMGLSYIHQSTPFL